MDDSPHRSQFRTQNPLLPKIR
ncbi:hypothetical protein LINPERHAP1_LOCUS28929 [Linum perenne]